MNTFRKQWSSVGCSKLGLSLAFLLLPSVSLPGDAAVAEASCLPNMTNTFTAPENTVYQYYFVVSLTDGSNLSIPFSERPVLTCEGTDLLLTTTQTEMSLPHGSVKEFTLTREAESTGVENVLTPGEMERHGDELMFSNCKAGSAVSVYDRSGRMVLTQHVDANGNCQISLQGRPAGIYIVKSESITCKILKK